MNPATVATLRSIKSSAIIVLLLIQLRGRPTRAKQIAETLAMDYETTRRHLRELAYLNIVSETPTGYILLQGGDQLVLTFDMQESAEKPRFLASTTTTTTIGKSSESERKAAEEAEKKRGNPALLSDAKQLKRGNSALSTLESYGISTSSRAVIHMVEQNDYITDEYIEAQADRLNAEGRFSTGLLLHVIRSGDPIPMNAEERAEARRKASFSKFT